jgi:hypothetical protein
MDPNLTKMVKRPVTVANFNDIDKLADDFLSETDLNLSKITTIKQRLANPDQQPQRCDELYPLRKFYITKESKRCNGCEHNVIKPENSVNSIKFKLHQMAIYMVPEVRIVTIPKWRLDEPNHVILSITNRNDRDVFIQLLTLPEVINNNDFMISKMKIAHYDTASIEFNNYDSNNLIFIDRQQQLSNTSPAMATSTHPSSVVTKSNVNNDGFIRFRRDNKIAISCIVTPLSSCINSSLNQKNASVIFGMKVSFDEKEMAQPSTSPTTPTAPTVSSSQPITKPSFHKIYINFGNIENDLIIEEPKYIQDWKA